MTLKDCTKDELIFVIERLQFYGLTAGDYYVRRALCDVEERREEQKHSKADQLLNRAALKQLEYIHLLEPYEGKPLVDIPEDVIKKASAAQKECEAANREWMKLMGIKTKK